MSITRDDRLTNKVVIFLIRNPNEKKYCFSFLNSFLRKRASFEIIFRMILLSTFSLNDIKINQETSKNRYEYDRFLCFKFV